MPSPSCGFQLSVSIKEDRKLRKKMLTAFSLAHKLGKHKVCSDIMANGPAMVLLEPPFPWANSSTDLGRASSESGVEEGSPWEEDNI